MIGGVGMLGMVGMIERIGMMGRGGIMMERVVTMGGVGMIKELDFFYN